MKYVPVFVFLVGSCTASALYAGSDSVEKNPGRSAPAGGWRFSAGFMHRSLGDFDWKPGTLSNSSLLTIGTGSNTPGTDAIGLTDAVADRTYANGFVRRDAGTDTNGDTWNWGYDSAGQISGNTVSFTGGNGTSATHTASGKCHQRRLER